MVALRKFSSNGVISEKTDLNFIEHFLQTRLSHSILHHFLSSLYGWKEGE